MPNPIFQNRQKEGLIFKCDGQSIAAQKTHIKQCFQYIVREISIKFISRQHSIYKILLTYNKHIDRLLRCFSPGLDNISVIAIGGYGRKERILYSDIDLLFLAKDEKFLHNHQLFEYIDVLQSLPIRIGYCTHNFDSLITYANNDLHLLTAITDARFICGDNAGMIYLEKKLKRKTDIPSFNDFLARKCQEQQTRDQKHPINYTPDIKKTVGNLRYLHTIHWLFNYMCPGDTISAVVEKKYIGQHEFDVLKQAHRFLSEIRFYLHVFYQRDENRLLLDSQQEIIKFFNHANNQSDQCIDPFMHQYYKAIHAVSRINHMIISALRNNVNRQKQ